jgi:hypothetical protein
MTLSDLLHDIKVEFPGFRLMPKSDSTFMSVLHVLLTIITLGGARKSFMEDYVTTIGNTIYIPNGWGLISAEEKVVLLRHERVHLRQARKYGAFLFAFLYLCFPLPLVFAYYRAKFEKEAYEESMRADAEQYGLTVLNDSYKAFILRQFTGPMYGWMWPFKAGIETWYNDTVKRVSKELSR